MMIQIALGKICSHGAVSGRSDDLTQGLGPNVSRRKDAWDRSPGGFVSKHIASRIQIHLAANQF